MSPSTKVSFATLFSFVYSVSFLVCRKMRQIFLSCSVWSEAYLVSTNKQPCSATTGRTNAKTFFSPPLLSITSERKAEIGLIPQKKGRGKKGSFRLFLPSFSHAQGAG